MTPEDHKEIHRHLHEALDQLVADYITHNEKTPSNTTVMELMAWSFDQTLNPTVKGEEPPEKKAPELTPVESSNIAAVGYDTRDSTLKIEFKNGGLYHYPNVPIAVYEELMAAPSLGKYFHLYIRSLPFEKQ